MLNSLQACRALAALLVVVCHANTGIFGLPKYFGNRPLGNIVDFAPAAIDFFFVLSGFIIMYGHSADLGQPRALGRFLWRRLSRVYLFYWVVLAAVLPVYFLAPQFGIGFERDPDVIIGSIFLLPHPQTHLILGVAWTLVFEMLFYLLFASLVLNKNLGTAIFLGWTLGLLVFPWSGLFPWIETFPFRFIFNNMHLRFIAGMLVCLIFQSCRIPAPRLVAVLGASLFAITGMFEVLYGPLSIWVYVMCYTLSSACIVGGLAEADRAGLIRSPVWLVNLGNATYAIYLVHFLALSAIAKTCIVLQLDQYVPLMVLLVMHVVGSVSVGHLCHRWIENPLDVWSKQFFRRPRTPTPVTTLPSTDPAIRKAA